MARSKPFLSGTILFSSISPDYAKNLLDELWGCFKNMKISFEELKRMPTRIGNISYEGTMRKLTQRMRNMKEGSTEEAQRKQSTNTQTWSKQT